jgi:extracellular elastinolytic metalloproteinase
MASFGLVVLLLVSLVSAVKESARHFESFHPAVPQTHLRTINGGGESFLSFIPSVETEDTHAIAIDLAEQALGFPSTYVVKNSYVTEHNNIRHVYLRQTAADGREIFNADLNINIHKKRALNVGHTFFSGSTAAQPGTIASVEAVNILLAFLKYDTDSVLAVPRPAVGVDLRHTITGVKGALTPATLRAGYMHVDGQLEPVWDIEVDMNLHWWSARVSSRSGQVLSVNDWVSDINSFNIYPIGVNDPSDGERAIVLNPATMPASPLGWNDQGSGTQYNTIGNNVYAQSNPTGGTAWLNNPRPSGGQNNDYNFPINFANQPASYVNASTTNLFAWNNYIHDIFYQYGFNEVSGNFQENNFNKGGLGNDAVQANCQDGAGTNNANMATPVDGQRPRMRMYVWTMSDPYRDGDLDQGIIMHEYAHGISNRLTGGPANSNCLGSGEAGGMGEGWGDWFATVIRQNEKYVRESQFMMGDYSANNPLGIRKFPYTTNMTVDPETYGYINGAAYAGVHAKGEVWCGILWEVYWNFIDLYGFDADLYLGEGGNNRVLRNVVDGMKLQPCNPNFVDARDAIFKADQANYGGQSNYCALWKGFAKRGLGVNAVGGRTGAPTVKEDFSVPVECENYGPTTTGGEVNLF